MAEPWLHPQCTDMLLYAAGKGHPIAVYSTLTGMRLEDFDRIRNCPINPFVVHLPDAHGHAPIPITDKYLTLLRAVVRFFTEENRRKVFGASCHGQIHPAVSEAIGAGVFGPGNGPGLDTQLIDRAGNLRHEELPHRSLTGNLACARSGQSLNHNVLLPDGTVLLCCMDYGMEHVLGNLLTCQYQDLLGGGELQRIRAALSNPALPCLCRRCSNAVESQPLKPEAPPRSGNPLPTALQPSVPPTTAARAPAALSTRHHRGPLRTLALVAAYNEGDVIYHVIGGLIEAGIQVYLTDNNSTDNTVNEARRWLGRGLIHIERFPQDAGYPEIASREYVWRDLLRRKQELAQTLDFDWYLHTDADEFRESPWPDCTLAEAIQRVDRLGYNAINFELLNFRPTDNSFVPGSDVRRCLLYYEGAKAFDLLQVKAWKNTGQVVNLLSSGGHDVQFSGRRVFPVRFILRHYPIRSEMHGRQKVFQDRQPRFNQAERQMGWHVQHDDFISGKTSFLRDPSTLIRYNAAGIREKLLSEASQVAADEPHRTEPLEAGLSFDFGFFQDEGGWRWMSETGQLLAPASATPSVFKADLACGKLSWYGDRSNSTGPLEIGVAVNGQTRQNLRFETDMQTLRVEQEIPASAKGVVIQLSSNKECVPAQNGINHDQRHLSVRLINPRLDAVSTTQPEVEPAPASLSAEETENSAHYLALAKTCLKKGDRVSMERLLLKALVLEPGNAGLLAAINDLSQWQRQPFTPARALKPGAGPSPNLAAPLGRLNKLVQPRFPSRKGAATSQAATVVNPAKSQTMPFCSAPWTIGWINETGTIQPCCRLGGFQRDLAKAGSLKAVWHGEEWVAFRNKVAQGEYPFDRCRQCREASTYQTLGKDFAGVPQGYLADLRAQQLSKEEADLCVRLAEFFNNHNFTGFSLPAAVVSQVAQLLQDGRAWRERVRETGNPLVNKLLTLLQVFYDLYTRNPYPEVIMPFRIPVIATRCNARCVMCSMVVEGSIEHGQFMDDSLLARSLAHPEQIIKIWAASTEILLHPRYQDIVCALHKAHVHLAISTNGMPLTETAARFLVDNRLKSLGLSINGATKEVFEGIMQRVSFDRFVKNVRFFMDYNKSQGSPVGVGFTMVALKRNIHQLPEIIRLIHSITGPGYGLHVSPLEAPGTDKQRAFYEQEQPLNVPREQLSAIFKEAACVARELGMSISCFYYKGIDEVIRDLDNIPHVTW